MMIIAKILAFLLLVAIVVAISGYLYLTREQVIEVRFIPNEFKYCGRVITNSDPEYKEISTWLHENSSGWVQDWNTTITGLVYSYPAFSVVVFKGGVSVSYKTDFGFPRFIKSVNHGLNIACAKNS
ncbi:MAG: hypothetical protein OIF51_19170 [Cellvibrionaceae bacterium]|nr:hypothetical protein [Cellvibrionaceae bacterium]